MSSGWKWMLMWRSRASSSAIASLVSQRAHHRPRRRASAPTLRRRHPALSQAVDAPREGRDDRAPRGGAPRRAHPRSRLRVAAGARGRAVRLAVVRALPRGPPPARARRLLRHRRRARPRAGRRRPSLLARPPHAPAPARARRAARAALPRAQDPRGRAVPPLMALRATLGSVPGPLSDLRDAVATASGTVVGAGDEASSPSPTLERPRKAGFGDYA